MTKKDQAKKSNKSARKTDPLKPAVPGTDPAAKSSTRRKGANGDPAAPTNATRAAPKENRAKQAPPKVRSGTPEPVETLEKGDMVVVCMRSEWELEGEFRASDDEVVRVFDFAVCDVLRLRRRDIARIEKLVEAD